MIVWFSLFTSMIVNKKHGHEIFPLVCFSYRIQFRKEKQSFKSMWKCTYKYHPCHIPLLSWIMSMIGMKYVFHFKYAHLFLIDPFLKQTF